MLIYMRKCVWKNRVNSKKKLNFEFVALREFFVGTNLLRFSLYHKNQLQFFYSNSFKKKSVMSYRGCCYFHGIHSTYRGEIFAKRMNEWIALFVIFDKIVNRYLHNFLLIINEKLSAKNLIYWGGTPWTAFFYHDFKIFFWRYDKSKVIR